MKAPSNNFASNLVTTHLPLVRRVAFEYAPQVPHIPLDDLIQEGSIGLMEAARAYDPSRYVKFTVYARHRILGRMKDFFRTYHLFGGRGHSCVQVAFSEAETPCRDVQDTKYMLDVLGPEERKLVKMFYIEGYTKQEISSICELTVERVGAILASVKEKLSVFL